MIPIASNGITRLYLLGWTCLQNGRLVQESMWSRLRLRAYSATGRKSRHIRKFLVHQSTNQLMFKKHPTSSKRNLHLTWLLASHLAGFSLKVMQLRSWLLGALSFFFLSGVLHGCREESDTATRILPGMGGDRFKHV